MSKKSGTFPVLRLKKTPFKSSAYPVRVPILKNRNAMRKGLEVSHCSTAHSTWSDY
jgi:hypothetical protein